MTDIRDNKALSRFELDVEGGMAFANYRLTPTAVVITHTETPRASSACFPKFATSLSTTVTRTSESTGASKVTMLVPLIDLKSLKRTRRLWHRDFRSAVLGGHGIASRLVEGALALIRADRRKVIGACGFVVDYLAKHPEYGDMVG